MTYNPNVCIQKVTDKGRIACDQLSFPYHCDTLTGVTGDYHQDCVDAGIMYFQVRVADCWNSKTNENKYFSPGDFFDKCGELRKSDPNWQQRWCYCCCACFARNTLVAVPGGVAEIYTIPKGAKVLCGAATSSSGGVKTDWSEARVKLSAGTRPGHQPMMVYIAFGEDKHKDLVCSADQPFLLADGKYTTAHKLRPGQQLVDRDGHAVMLQLVSIGSYEGAVHHIATNRPWSRNPDGHLLLTGGVVAGDFDLQLKFDQLPASMKESNYDALPIIGTPEYENIHAKNIQRSNVRFDFTRIGVVGPEAGQKYMEKGLFQTYKRATSNVPIGAQTLLTSNQAADVLENGTQAPFSDQTAKMFFDSIVDQLSGFYPDIVFYLDLFDVMPNLYAFEAYGKKIVQVSGGLVRLNSFNYEGLAMAIAHGVGSLVGGDPKIESGYSAVGQADAFAFRKISSQIWIGDPAFNYLEAAISQWTLLFGLVNPDHAKGTPKDPLNAPSLDCRLKTIKSASVGGALPECAGGTPRRKIWLEQATAQSEDKVVLVFSLALDPDSADNPNNYTLAPEADVISAKRNEQSDFKVDLKLKLKPGISYTITAKNLTSVLGTGLDPNHMSVAFDAPEYCP